MGYARHLKPRRHCARSPLRLQRLPVPSPPYPLRGPVPSAPRRLGPPTGGFALTSRYRRARCSCAVARDRQEGMLPLPELARNQEGALQIANAVPVCSHPGGDETP